MTLASGIYRGEVRHRRESPAVHDFTFPMFMMYLDLAELGHVFEGALGWSTRGPAPAWFRRADYLDGEVVEDDGRPVGLDEAVRRRVERATGRRPDGPIRMLTHLRYFGYIFNPVTFYYCFDGRGEAVRTIVAEITNTPWGERHAYVLDGSRDLMGTSTGAAGTGARAQRFKFDKQFHVSPFLPMDIDYDWSFSRPGDELDVAMVLRRFGGPASAEGPGESAAGPPPKRSRVFTATMHLRREEISPAALGRTLARYPFLTLRVIARIHFEAARLWLKRVPVHPHPRRMPARGAAIESIPAAAGTGERP